MANRVTDHVTRFEHAILFLIFLSVGLVFIEMFVYLTPEQEATIRIVDGIVIACFAIDLVIEYRRYRDPEVFFHHCWLDILAIVPFTALFRLLKFAKVVRMTRALGEYVKTEQMSRGARKTTKLPKPYHLQRARPIVLSRGSRNEALRKRR
ncbi:ion transporter [Candidatus Woesearchaeota archaeon]|nr:ion transporter [Candidatus Woesearchaeota archaeon]